MRYMLLILLLPIVFLAAFKIYQAWEIWRSVPSGYAVRLTMHAGIPDFLRAQQYLGQGLEDAQALRRYFGLYGRKGSNVEGLASSLSGDRMRLSWVAGAGESRRLLVVLFAPGYGQKAGWRDLFSVGAVISTPSANEARQIEDSLGSRWRMQHFVSGGKRLVAGRTGLDDVARSEQLMQQRLSVQSPEILGHLVLHRVNTLYRLHNYAPFFRGIELDVISADGRMEINHPPMQRTGLLLQDLAADLSAEFVWLDWKNPESSGFNAAVDEIRTLMAGREYLVEVPLEYFRQGGELPGDASVKFSVYLPTKEIGKCRDGCPELAAFINGLLAKYANLDCSFDAAIFPWVSQHVRCGRNHGVYSWSLSPLSTDGAYEEMLARYQELSAFASRQGASRFRFIVRNNSAFI